MILILNAPGPPRRTEWLLGLLLPADVHGDAVLGDLREEYARRVARQDPRAAGIARSWYRREALALGVRYAAVRLGRLVRRRAPPAWLEHMSRDFTAAARSLVRDPAFLGAAAGVLAIGIGAVTAVFTLVDRALFQPLPYADENRIVSVYEADASGAIRLVSYPTFRAWQPEARTFEDLAFVHGERLGVRTRAGWWLLAASYGTPELFAVMRAQPALGRVFEPADARAPVAVLAWHTWRERFGGSIDIIGRTLSTDHGPVTVIGVMPNDVRYPAWSDLWLPLSALPPRSLEALERHDPRADSGVVGRIRVGVTLDRAAVELSALAKRTADAQPEDSRGWTRAVLRSLRDELVGAQAAQLLVLAIAAGVLLLIAGANVAGMLVARTTARRHELALRAALGATRRYLTGPLAAESLIIALIGGALGAALAMVTVRLLANAVPDALPRLDGAAVDARALAVTTAASILSGLAFATLLARRVAGVQPACALRNPA